MSGTRVSDPEEAGQRRQTREFERWVTGEIRDFVRRDPRNRFELLDGSPIFDEPRVGFVAGDDPIFQELKRVIGAFHLTPHEVLTAAAEKQGVEPPEAAGIGIVSYVLPVSTATRRENARRKDRPSARWAHTRLFGEQFNRAVQAHLVDVLRREGYLAVAPELEADLFRAFSDEEVGWASTWSQRHVAFSAGLGSFGLSDGLITAVGKAHRVGSVVVSHPLVSPETRRDVHGDCLAHRGVNCRTCMKRCPAGAISEAGHDKVRCSQFVFEQIPFIKENYGIDIYGCGLCQVGVPCEARVPRAKDVPDRGEDPRSAVAPRSV